MKTITEVAKLVGLSVRQIQECEKEELNLMKKPERKKRYEHGSLYSEEDIEKLWLISIYKKAGYKNPEIAKIFNNPKYNAEESLKKLITKLQDKKREIDVLIDKAETMLEMTYIITPSSIRNSILGGDDMTYDTALSIIKLMQECMNSKFSFCVSEEDLDTLENKVDTIISVVQGYKVQGFNASSEVVQKQISNFHVSFVEVMPVFDLLMFFGDISVFFSKGGVWAKKLEEEYDEEFSTFFKEALDCYILNNIDGDFAMCEALCNIVQCGKANCRVDSVEVQKAVQECVNVLKGLGLNNHDVVVSIGRLAFSINKSRALAIYDKKSSPYLGFEKFVAEALLFHANKLVEK